MVAQGSTSEPGSSIAVNGICLTAVDPGPASFSADVAPETIRRSNLRDLAAGSPVNLERLPIYTGQGDTTAPHDRLLLAPLKVR